MTVNYHAVQILLVIFTGLLHYSHSSQSCSLTSDSVQDEVESCFSDFISITKCDDLFNLMMVTIENQQLPEVVSDSICRTYTASEKCSTNKTSPCLDNLVVKDKIEEVALKLNHPRAVGSSMCNGNIFLNADLSELNNGCTEASIPSINGCLSTLRATAANVGTLLNPNTDFHELCSPLQSGLSCAFSNLQGCGSPNLGFIKLMASSFFPLSNCVLPSIQDNPRKQVTPQSTTCSAWGLVNIRRYDSSISKCTAQNGNVLVSNKIMHLSVRSNGGINKVFLALNDDNGNLLVNYKATSPDLPKTFPDGLIKTTAGSGVLSIEEVNSNIVHITHSAFSVSVYITLMGDYYALVVGMSKALTETSSGMCWSGCHPDDVTGTSFPRFQLVSKECSSLGTNSPLLDICTADVTSTGKEVFADQAVWIQSLEKDDGISISGSETGVSINLLLLFTTICMHVFVMTVLSKEQL